MSNFWDENYIKDLEKQLAKNLERAAIHLANKVKENINTSQPYKRSKGETITYKGLEPSAPGEYPKKITGSLQRSIAYEISEDKKSAKVGTNLEYGEYLELGTVNMQARPYLRSTLDQESGKIGDILAEGM